MEKYKIQIKKSVEKDLLSYIRDFKKSYYVKKFNYIIFL